MNRREFIKTAGIGTACLLAGQFSMFAEGGARRMEIKAVKLYENGFMTQPFAMGLEEGEDKRACCISKVAEETGPLVPRAACALQIDEYYENWKWVNRYFFCEVTGKTEPHLTDREKEVGMEPRWIDLDEIIAIFSNHAAYADTDEMRRGMYLREFTALKELIVQPEKNHK